MEYNGFNSSFNNNNMFPMNDYSYTNDKKGVEHPIPFYRAYQMSGNSFNVEEEERDKEKFQDMYPKTAKDVQQYVDEQCDKMEYDGSLMFDEYPDKVMIRNICAIIYKEVKKGYDLEDIEVERDEMLAMNRRHPDYGYRNNWMQDLIEVMLFNEIYRRRCRRRNCNRRH